MRRRRAAAWIVALSCLALASRVDADDRLLAFEESAERFALGLASHRAGQLRSAEEHFRAALELDPAFVEALVGLALARIQAGEADGVEQLLVRAQTLRPDYHRTYTVRAVVALHRDDPEAAVELLARALDLEPDDLETLSNLGAAWILAGRPERAREPLGRALRLDPRFADAALNLAIAEERRGRAHRAAYWYRRFLALARRDDPFVRTARHRAGVLGGLESAGGEALRERFVGADHNQTQGRNEP